MLRLDKIIILCGYPFPEGMAPTTRILAYSKGLKQNGVDVEVVSFDRIQSSKHKRIDGIAKGIPYHIPYCYNPHKFKNRWYRLLWANWCLRFGCVKEIVRTHRQKKVNAVLMSFDTPWTLLFYGLLLSLFGIKVGFIGDEFPEPIRRLKEDIPRWYALFYKIAYKFISFRILMTYALQKYYDEKVCKKPTYIFSSVVDTERFDYTLKNHTGREYLCYMGNLMLAKDNVDNIVRAFALIADDFPEIDLYMYGNPDEKDGNYIKSIIQEYDLSKRAILKGKVSFDEVPKILVNAKILVTSQPNTVRAAGGFPTKMCEYMMSEVPTILTNVGEIHEYITDEVNAYLVEACNPEQYALKLRWILNNYDEALKVAKKAKEYVVNTYSPINATKGLKQFLSSYAN